MRCCKRSSMADVAKQALLFGLSYNLAVTSSLASSPLDAVIRPGTIPLDIEGKEIHAHDAGMFQEGNTYYWYGCTKKVNRGDWLSDGVNVYSSNDFQNWSFLGKVFSADQIKGTPWGTGPPWRLERPKIIFNKATGYYVMLFHLDDVPFSLTAVGFARSKKIEGPFEWVGWVKPGGKRSYDMTAFVDDDGKGYLVNSVENEYVGIWPLSDDYLEVLGSRPCGKGPRGEGPAVFKTNATSYHMLASHLTGWDPNPEMLFNHHGKDPCGTWVQTATPPQAGPGSNTTWNSQSTYVFPMVIGDQTLFIYMGDRWNYRGPKSLDIASYVWLPLLPTSGPGAEPGAFMLQATVESDGVTLAPWSPRDYIGKTVVQPHGQAIIEAESEAEATKWAAAPLPSQGRASGLENYYNKPGTNTAGDDMAAVASAVKVESAKAPAVSEGIGGESLGLLEGHAPAGKPAPHWENVSMLA